MKRIILIRHAESDSLTLPEDRLGNPLTLNGQHQARLVAARLAAQTPDLLITTPTRRSRETAAIVQELLKIPTVESELFLEKHPIRESTEFLSKRVQQAVRFLEGRSEQSILVVSHGDFLQAFAHHLLSAGASALPPETIAGSHHTGVSECTYEAATNQWTLETWDDRSHLT